MTNGRRIGQRRATMVHGREDAADGQTTPMTLGRTGDMATEDVNGTDDDDREGRMLLCRIFVMLICPWR